MEYTLLYSTPWDQVNEENDNIDVCLTCADGRSYTFVVATPENLKQIMASEGKSYLSPGAPMLIVQTLTQHTIADLMAEIVEDEALLRCYGSDLL